jgi:hypothetical protein
MLPFRHEKEKKRDMMDYCERCSGQIYSHLFSYGRKRKGIRIKRGKKERIALLRNNLILYLAYQYTNYRVEEPNKQFYSRSNRLDPSSCFYLHLQLLMLPFFVAASSSSVGAA